jgi:cysteine desulfurase
VKIEPFGLNLYDSLFKENETMLKFPIYLDHNATTPCDPRVVEAMLPYFSGYFGNAASRSHAFGWQAEEAVEFAREQVAKLVGAEPREIVFTSGATEADNLALKGVYDTYASRGNHIITVKTEHKAVLDTCKHIEKEGGEITYLPVNPDGLIDVAELEAAIKPTTILIAVMYANNETGVIQPVKEISAIAKERGVLFFTDAAQAIGKIPIDVKRDGIDIMSVSGHKFYGPKGVGALYVRRKNPRVQLTAQMDGGGHERGMRSGTLNVPAIVGFGKACEIAMQEMEQDAKRLSALRDDLETALLQEDAQVNGNTGTRLAHVTNISFRNLEPGLVLGTVNKEIAVSSGSACTSASMEPSYVLKAMQVNDDLAYNSIRFSLGKNTTKEEVDYTIEFLQKTIKKFKEVNVA